VDEHRLAQAFGVADVEQEAVPRAERPKQPPGTRLVGVALEQQAHARRGQRRLGQGGDPAAVGRYAPPPPAGTGRVAAVGDGEPRRAGAG
jgi:hypothetical protein